VSSVDEPGPPPATLPHPLAPLANALRVLLLLAAVLAAAVAYLAVRMRAALDEADPDALVPGASAKGEVDAFFNGTQYFFLAFVAIGVLFVLWMWRAARNNQSFGRPGALGPGWALGAWFIPIGSVVIPAIQLQQLWRGADGSVPRGDVAWRNSSSNAQLWVWWVAYVLGQGLVVLGFMRLGSAADDEGRITAADLLTHLPDVRTGVTLFVAGQALLVVAAGLGAAMVLSLTRRQESAATALGPALPGAVPRGFGRPVSPPAWHPDPTGRFDERWWDGQLWTDHVVRDGERAEDPVDP
jgi:hypothetical protein